MQSLPPEMQLFEDLFRFYDLSDEMNNLVEACEYDYGDESDLFKAPEPIIEEPTLAVDPFSLDLVEEFSDLGSLQSDQQLIDKSFYECEQNLLMKSAMESPLSVVLDIKNISLVAKMDNVVKSSSSEVVSDVSISKSVSSGNLNSMDMVQHEDVVIQSLPGFHPMDYGIRRALSEGDIQTMGSQLDHIIVSCTSENRREKLSRYRNKKSRRNFGRKIKYACRKALADSQPRIRGRFAKNRGDAKNDED